MESKVCSICGIEKPLSEFALNKTRKDGHASDCKSCRKKYRMNIIDFIKSIIKKKQQPIKERRLKN